MARAAECFELGSRLSSVELETVRALDYLDHRKLNRAAETAAAAANLAGHMAEKHRLPIAGKVAALARVAEGHARRGEKAMARAALERARGAAVQAVHEAMRRCGASRRMRG